MRTVELHLTRDLDEFSARAGAFLEAKLEHNQLATVLIRARTGFHSEAPPLFAYGLDNKGEVNFAAIRTPPWPMLTSPAEELDGDRLMELWLPEDPGVPGVTGELSVARSLGEAWERASGGRAGVLHRTALHVLLSLRDPERPVAGYLRSPREADRALLVEWEGGFLRDAGIEFGIPPERLVAARLTANAQFIWDDGAPVSTLAISPEVAGTVRIGPVYTPPQMRGRGYASSAVAEICRRAFAGGAERLALFTDLENPTSNKIYSALGFRRVADWAEITFER